MNGMFSVYNVLAALTVAYAMGLDMDNAIKALEPVKGVAGRFEVVVHHPLVIVDYAHTPDGLQNVLNAAREITPENRKELQENRSALRKKLLELDVGFQSIRGPDYLYFLHPHLFPLLLLNPFYKMHNL